MLASKKFAIVILAAGKGVRMRSSLPKALIPVCGKSMLERLIRSCNKINVQEAVLEKVLVVIGHEKALVLEEIQKLSRILDIEVGVVEQEEQRGTGHAVQVALPMIDSGLDFLLVLPCDLPLISENEISKLILSSIKRSSKIST